MQYHVLTRIIHKVANRVGISLNQFVPFLGQLNSKIPADLRPEHLSNLDQSTHDSLRKILQAYLQSIRSIDACLRTTTSPPDIKEMISRIVEEAARIVISEARHVEDGISTVPTREQFERDMSDASSLARPSGHHRMSHYGFEEIKMLGRGTGGVVYKVREFATGELFARKDIHLSHDSIIMGRTKEQVQNEIEIMKKLRHPHITTVILQSMDEEVCSIIMSPSADMNLKGYLDSCIVSGASQAKTRMVPWFVCLLSALGFAHKVRVMHRDIKPSNILIKNQQVYLADFGEAKDYSNHDFSRASNDVECGTPNYRAPESVHGSTRDFPEDLYSLGCVFSEMLTVYCGRSLEEYQKFREDKGADYPFAFRNNPRNVVKWTRNLEGNDEVRYALVSPIIRMISESPQARSTAERLENDLLRENPGLELWCGGH